MQQIMNSHEQIVHFRFHSYMFNVSDLPSDVLLQLLKAQSFQELYLNRPDFSSIPRGISHKDLGLAFLDNLILS